MIDLPLTLPPINKKIVEGMQLRFPILEDPPGSNRSPEIDRLCKRWGVPLGSPWCALLATDVWYDAGAAVPPNLGGKTKTGRDRHPAVAEWWREWALKEGLFSATPMIGAAVLYGSGGKEPAVHIDVCVTVITPALMSFGGNESESGFSREGTLTTHSRVQTDRLIGYVLPRLRSA
jgi:hypothetical protein